MVFCSFGVVGPQRTCPQVQDLVGSVTQGVSGLGDIGRGWDPKRAELTLAHSRRSRGGSGGKWNMGIFCVEAPCASRARAGLEYVSIILCQTPKISPGPGVRFVCSCLIFGMCFSYVFCPCWSPDRHGIFVCPRFSRITSAQRKPFVITQHVYLERLTNRNNKKIYRVGWPRLTSD